MLPRRLAVGVSSLLVIGMIYWLPPYASGQSGRRLPDKGKSQPEPPPAPKEESSPGSASSEKDKEAAMISVVSDVAQLSAFSSLYYDAVSDGCGERLRKAISLKVQMGRGVNRKEAHDKAQSGEAWVAWFEIGDDGMRGDRRTSNNPDNLWVHYVLFTPKTGKTKSDSRIYLMQLTQVGGVGLPLPQTRNLNYLFHRAGQEMANRILATLNLAAPK